ncbi:MAG: hypothetical protein IKG27_00100 [Bacilli bacterium]|nr:hypothetical protein [Bacilli bacterium]
MTQKARGIYSIKHISNDGHESILRVKEGKIFKEKFPLTTIDAITTTCDNMEGFLKLARKLHKPKKNSYDDWSDGYCYIEYKHEGEVKRIPLVFSDNLILSELSKNYEGQSVMKGEKNVTIWAHKAINIRRKNEELYAYLKKHGYISRYLAPIIGEYVFFTGENYQNPEEANIRLTMIKTKLSEYKAFRDLVVGIDMHQKEKEAREERQKEIERLKAVRETLVEEFIEPEIVERIEPEKGRQMSFSDIGFKF